MAETTRDQIPGTLEQTAATAPRHTRQVDLADMDAARSGTIELAQEFASVEIERREGGTVRLRTVTEAEDSVVQAQTRRETVEVVRHKVDREVDTAPEPRVEGDVTIIPVVEERAVVLKRLFVTEEIHIRRSASVEDVELPVNLRRQRAVVERLDENGATMPVETGIGTPRDQ